MIPKKELEERIEKAGAIRRWYQDVPYGKIKPSTYSPFHFGDGKTNLESYGDGRWKNYVVPIMEQLRKKLDFENSTLCEVGCNAGLFLLRAWEQFNFCRLLGVEGGLGGYKQLLLTQEYYDKMPLKVYNVSVGKLEPNIDNKCTQRIDMVHFPMVDITLLSCVHYHMVEKDWIEYLQSLCLKSMYLLVVTEENGSDIFSGSSALLTKTIQSIHPVESIVSIGNGWKEISRITTPQEWLKKQRFDKYKNLTTILYVSTHLKRLDVNECFEKQLKCNEYNKIFYQKIFPKFIKDVLQGKVTDENCTLSEVYKWQAKDYANSTAWKPPVARQRTLSYRDIVISMKDHGQEQPILLNPSFMVDPWDGFHRIAVLKHFGVKYVFGKEIVTDVWPKCKNG